MLLSVELRYRSDSKASHPGSLTGPLCGIRRRSFPAELTIVLFIGTIASVNAKQKKTLDAIFQIPTPANVSWSDIEALLRTLGAELSEGSGSRIRIKLNDVRAVFHRPHPQKETDRGSLRSMKRFLENAGVKP